MFWKLTLFYLFLTFKLSFSFTLRKETKPSSYFLGQQRLQTKRQPLSSPPSLRAGMVCAWAIVGVFLCVRECMRECAPLFLFCWARAAPPFVLNTSLSFYCPRHAPLLPSSSMPTASPSPFSLSKRTAPPLVLNTNRSFLRPRHAINVAFHFM